jgi:hypothetical protein
MRALALVAALAGLAPSAAWADSDAGAAGPVIIPTLEPGAPTLTVSPSARELGLGEVFYLFVEVTYAAGVEVNLPVTLPLGPAIEETARTDRLQRNPDGSLTRSFELALMVFDVGDLVIPPLPVTYVVAGEAHEVVSDTVPIRVHGVIGDGDGSLRDIAPPVPVVRRDLALVYVAGGSVAFLVLVALVWRLARRRHRRTVAVRAAAAAAQKPAHDEALARLDELEASGALDADDRKPAYLALSEIVRAYLGRRYGFPALDLTTAEIRSQVGEVTDGGAPLEAIVSWLDRCDLVKFANEDASQDEARQALYDARIFVERTRVGAEITTAAARAVSAPDSAREVGS